MHAELVPDWKDVALTKLLDVSSVPPQECLCCMLTSKQDFA